MSTGDSLQQAWQWLTPPAVEDGQGGLIPRRRLRSAAIDTKQGALDFERNTAQPLADRAVDAIDFVEDEPPVQAALPVHPGASHSAQLQGRSVAYLLRC